MQSDVYMKWRKNNMNYTLEDIKKQSPYPIGELNTAYAK